MIHGWTIVGAELALLRGRLILVRVCSEDDIPQPPNEMDLGAP